MDSVLESLERSFIAEFDHVWCSSLLCGFCGPHIDRHVFGAGASDFFKAEISWGNRGGQQTYCRENRKLPPAGTGAETDIYETSPLCSRLCQRQSLE
jgi:hypothetical protein